MLRKPPSRSKPQPQEERGLATGILSFVAILVAAALLYTMLDPAITDVFSMSTSQASSQQAKDVIAQREQVWDNVLYLALFIGSLAILARAVFESRRPG